MDCDKSVLWSRKLPPWKKCLTNISVYRQHSDKNLHGNSQCKGWVEQYKSEGFKGRGEGKYFAGIAKATES